LARWSINFAPESASLSEGLRAAAACASLAAIAVLMHDPSLAWAAVMAFWTCLVDPGGPNRVRARMLGLFVVGATGVALLSAGMAGFGVAPAAATLLIVAFACSYLRVYGAEVSTLSNLLVVDAVVTIARPVDSPAALLAFGGVCLVGCLWAAALSLTVWRIHPFAAARTALGQVYRRFAAMAVDLAAISGSEPGAAAWTDLAQLHRRAVRLALEEARRLLDQAVDGRGGEAGASAAAERLFAGLAEAETLFAYLIALSDTLEREGAVDPDQRRRTDRLLRQTASVFHRMGRFLEALEGDPGPVRLALVRVERGAPGAGAAVCRLLREFAAEASHLIDSDPSDAAMTPTAGAASPLAQRLWAPLKANLNGNSIYLRHAARVSVCVVIAFLICDRFHIPYGYWMTTTVVLVQQPYLSNSWVRAIERVVGGVVGGGLAALLGLVFHSQAALLVLIFPLAMATMSFRAVNYSLYVIFLTPLFVLILDLTHPGVREVSLAGIRALNTVIGGVVALAGCLLLWPSFEGDRLKSNLADAVERYGLFASLALDPTDDDEQRVKAARRQAGIAANRADDARRRAALETWWRRGELDMASAVQTALRRLAGSVMTLRLEGRLNGEVRGGEAIGAWCARTTQDLAAALRLGRPIPAEPAEPPPVVGSAGAIVAEIRDLYRAARASADLML
jgi:uncharacterized membrane protein YccC